jgi:hypothetical protein
MKSTYKLALRQAGLGIGAGTGNTYHQCNRVEVFTTHLNKKQEENQVQNGIL